MTKRSKFGLFARWRVREVRGLLLTWRIRAMGGKVGRNLQAEMGVQLRYPPHRGWEIGDSVYLARGVVLSAPGELKIGDRVRIMHYTQIAALGRIEIGDLTQIAESCSIRDHDHDLTADSIADADDLMSTTLIGRDVWVGRGVAVLAGVTIGDQAVIGANAVVNRDVPADSLAVGVPARVKRQRRP